jgi:hypothetical protein
MAISIVMVAMVMNIDKNGNPGKHIDTTMPTTEGESAARITAPQRSATNLVVRPRASS